MKKKYTAVRLFSAFVMFAVAVTMSCTDHVNPDPEPVAHCNRLNGQPRAFPCEFEIEKLEFMSGSSNTVVFETLTPTDSLFQLSGPYYSWEKTGTETYKVRYKIRLTYKRIAEAPQGVTNEYVLYMTTGGIDSEDFLDWASDIGTDMAVGETRSEFYIIDYNLAIWDSITNRKRMLSIVNLGTYNILKAAPYHYDAVRDRAESWIRFKPF